MSVYIPNVATLGTLAFNTADSNGVMFWLEKLEGWGSPKSTVQVTQKPRSHGGWRSEAFLTPRTIVLTGTIEAPTAALLAQSRHALNAAASLSDTAFSVTEYGETLYATVARNDEVIYGGETPLWTSFSVQLIAPDPLRYGPIVTASTGMASSSGGLTWPVTWPVSWPSTVSSGTISINNPGNETVYPLIRVDGPCPGPILTHIGSGTQLVLSSSLVLQAGEWLLIDMKRRKTLANGQSSRDGYITSLGWFGFEPGPNDIACAGSVYNAGALFTVTTPMGAWS
jgi:hypothetical protein